MSQETIATLEARVKAIEDCHEISNVIASYSLAAGTGDLQRLIAQFADDAVMEGKGGAGVGKTLLLAGRESVRHAGKAALRELYQRVLSEGQVSRHQVQNVHVIVDGDTAEAESMWTTMKNLDGSVVQRAGYYRDEFVRTPSGWKIKRRVVTFLPDLS